MSLRQEYQDARKDLLQAWNQFDNCKNQYSDVAVYRIKAAEENLSKLMNEIKENKKELPQEVPVEKTFMQKFVDRLYHLRRVNAND
jgi:hypothetical protein